MVVGALAILLTASFAHADDPIPADPPASQAPAPAARVALRVVKVLADSHQALLYDRHRGTHVLVDEGGAIDGLRVLAITDDEVVLAGEGREVVLAAPAPPEPPRAAPPRSRAPATEAHAAPIDPYAPLAPLDPYAALEPVRSAPAPTVIQAGDGGVRVASAPPYPATTVTVTAPAIVTILAPPVTGATAPGTAPGTAPATGTGTAPATATAPAPGTAPATGTGTGPAPAPAAAPDGAPVRSPTFGFIPPGTAAEAAPTPVPAAPTTTTTTVDRAELTTVLADFGVLTSQLRGEFSPDGARLDTVAPGSVFARAGLRAGDTVTAIDGRPLRSIDDAADLYVHAQTARTARIELLRGGVPVSLRVVLQ